MTTEDAKKGCKQQPGGKEEDVMIVWRVTENKSHRKINKKQSANQPEPIKNYHVGGCHRLLSHSSFSKQ